MNADSLGGELLPGEVIIFEDNTPQLRGSVCRYWRLSASRMSLIDPVDTPELLGTCEVGLPGHFITLGTQSKTATVVTSSHRSHTQAGKCQTFSKSKKGF